MKKILSIFMLLAAFTTGAWAETEWSTVWSADFSSVPQGMTYSVSNGSTSISNGYLEYHQGGGSGNRAINTGFIDAAFNVDTNWKMEFDWNASSANQNPSNVSFATNSGVAFTLTWASYATAVVVTDAASETLASNVPILGYNKGTCNSWNHITIVGDTEKGIYLTITDGTTTYVDNVLVSSTFGYPATFNGSLGRAVSHMFIDNIDFATPKVAGFVAAPTSTITAPVGTARKFTLSCLTEGTTIYYSDEDIEIGGEGWTAYKSEVTTSAETIYAYATDGENNSEKMSFATGAGTTISLVDAIFTHSNKGVYTIASNQSSILGAPTATIHYQIDGGSEKSSTEASINVDILSDGVVTYWLTADGYDATEPQNENVFAPRAYVTTNTIDFCTSNDNTWAIQGDVVDVDGDNNIYYQYLDQNSNIVGEGLLATTFNNADQTWRIQRYYGGTMTYNTTEYVAVKNLKAGQIVQFICNSAPSSVVNLTSVPASTYTGTYSYSATADGDVIASFAKNVIITKIYICDSSISGTLPESGIGTLASAYALDLSGVEAYVISNIDGSGRAICAPITEAPANTGIIIVGEKNAEYSIPVVASAKAPASNLLVGAVEATNLSEGDYIMQGGKFCPILNASQLAAGKAYLPAGINEAKAITLSFGEITGISEAEAAEAPVAAEGKFIENGKLVIVKNGQKFNANGQKLN